MDIDYKFNRLYLDFGPACVALYLVSILLPIQGLNLGQTSTQNNWREGDSFMLILVNGKPFASSQIRMLKS